MIKPPASCDDYGEGVAQGHIEDLFITQGLNDGRFGTILAITMTQLTTVVDSPCQYVTLVCAQEYGGLARTSWMRTR